MRKEDAGPPHEPTAASTAPFGMSKIAAVSSLEDPNANDPEAAKKAAENEAAAKEAAIEQANVEMRRRRSIVRLNIKSGEYIDPNSPGAIAAKLVAEAHRIENADDNEVLMKIREEEERRKKIDRGCCRSRSRKLMKKRP